MRGKLREKHDWIVDCVFISIFAAALIWPIFRTKYYENWFTIDSTFIADARFLMENGPHPGWNPLWYGGTRWDYIYPPALRYGSALLAQWFHLLPARGYHLYTAIFYSLGIGWVYFFARIGSGVRLIGWLAAFCAATLSPSFLFLAIPRWDVKPYMPQRLNVLVRYGEGPHMTAFALLPLGLALAWRGLRKGHARWLAGSSLVFALVVSNNFYGATALAMFFPVLTWAVYCETRDARVWLRSALTALLSWGLCGFWLTPSFLKVTARNLALVAQPGHSWSLWLMAILLLIFGLISWRYSSRGISAWTIFVAGSTLVFAVTSIGNYHFDFRITGEPSRLVPETDLCFILFLIWVGYLIWQRWPVRLVRTAVCVFFFFSCVPAYHYFYRPWHHLNRTSEYKHRKEYQLAEWVNQNRPHTRTYVTGTARFWWNAWFNGEQIGGGSEQGVLNLQIVPFFWRTVLSEDPHLDVAWMQSLGVDNVIVNDNTSQLPIVDYMYPHKYKGVLRVLWEDGQGNWIYAIPRKNQSRARVVDLSRYASLRSPKDGSDEEAVNAYADVMERSSNAIAETRWLNSDTLAIDAEILPGQALAVQVSFDDYWRARENGQQYSITRDALGQMRIDLPAGRHHIEMRFETPLENTAGLGATAVALAFTLFLLTRRERRPVG